MDRLACVSIPVLPLQLLLRQHPAWRGEAVAVVDKDKPQGVIQWANGLARQAGVLPGMRYAAALNLARGLRGKVVPEALLHEQAQALTRQLQRFSPRVEPHPDEPGVFWLDAGGLVPLFASLDDWARCLRQDLKATGWEAIAVVGFGRFGTYAVAKTLRQRKSWVFASALSEQSACERVPLAVLGLSPVARDQLAQLGVRWLGDFMRLPARGLLRRLGPEVHRWHQLATGQLDWPLQPVPLDEPLVASQTLDYLESDWIRLLFILKPLLEKLLQRLARRSQALSAVTVRLTLDDGARQQETIRTAEPSLEAVVILDLLRLRLEAIVLSAPVVAVELAAEGDRASREQLSLFAQRSRRDLAAAGRALARVRAALGEESVVRAVLQDKHLPEMSFSWEPLGCLAWPRPQPAASAAWVRQIWDKPVPLAPCPAQGMEVWRPLGPHGGRVVRLDGPHVVAGGWWKREVMRDYYFLALEAGQILWVYYDHQRGQWFWQGEVA